MLDLEFRTFTTEQSKPLFHCYKLNIIQPFIDGSRVNKLIFREPAIFGVILRIQLHLRSVFYKSCEIIHLDGMGAFDFIDVGKRKERVANFNSHAELFGNFALQAYNNILAIINMPARQFKYIWQKFLSGWG